MNRVFLELFSNQWWPLIAYFIPTATCISCVVRLNKISSLVNSNTKTCQLNGFLFKFSNKIVSDLSVCIIVLFLLWRYYEHQVIYPYNRSTG